MYRKIPPERPYLLDASGGEGRMGESYLPHSVLHEKVLTLRKLFVHLVHRPKVKSQESYRPDKTQGLCDPWSRGWALVRTFPTGLSTRPQYSTASQTVTESYEDTINHVPDKKSGRGGWERRGALAGFYGTSILIHVPGHSIGDADCTNLIHITR